MRLCTLKIFYASKHGPVIPSNAVYSSRCDINITLKVEYEPKEQTIIFTLQTFIGLCKTSLRRLLQQKKKHQPSISSVAKLMTGHVSAEKNRAEESRTQVN